MFPEFFSPRALRLMCLADEIEPGQAKQFMGRVKGETTAECVKDNEKFGPKPQYHNACRNVLCTNHPNALDADQEQCRVAVFRYTGLIRSTDP